MQIGDGMWPGQLRDEPNRGANGGHGLVRLGDSDTVVPASVTRTLEGENGHPDLVMTFEVRDGRPECVDIRIKSKPEGRGIKQADLRGFVLDELSEIVFARFASRVAHVADDGTWLAEGPLWEEREQWAARRDVAEARQSQRQPPSLSELQRVADIYKEHQGNKPIQAVQLLLGYNSRRTAARRAQQARERGLFNSPPPDDDRKDARPETSEAARADAVWRSRGLSALSSEHVATLIESHEAAGRPDLALALKPLHEQLSEKESADGEH